MLMTQISEDLISKYDGIDDVKSGERGQKMMPSSLVGNLCVRPCFLVAKLFSLIKVMVCFASPPTATKYVGRERQGVSALIAASSIAR